MSTKNILLGIALLQIFAISCGENSKPKEDVNNKLAIEEIRKEPKITEAFLTDSNVLYVSVVDDGTLRDGYARYLCEILREHKATTSTVKIIKVVSVNDPDRDNSYGVLLGESNCK